MSNQKFSASQREALWLAYEKKCAYTRELLDVSSFHVDHILPERLADDPIELERIRNVLHLPDTFDIFGYENLLPSRPGANLQKASLVLDVPHTHFFMGLASSKRKSIEEHLAKIERRNVRGKALILLQQCLERGELDPSEVATIIEEHVERPEEIFQLIEGLRFADATEVRTIARAEIETLRDRPIRLGQNDHIDGVALSNNAGQNVYVRTCREYCEAIRAGFFACTTFDIKMATFFEHQCGLLSALQAASTPQVSFIAEPRVGIIDIELMPFTLFPRLCEETTNTDITATYQSKVTDGTIVIKRVRQNLLHVAQPHGMGHQLIEVARADFNGDGLEDILLFEYCYATHGTLGFGSTRVLTRKTKEGSFEPV